MAVRMTVLPGGIDEATNIQDRIRLFLSNLGTRTVSVTVDDLASQLGLTYPQAYQALKRMQTNNEIDFEKEESATGRERITGIILKKLEPSGRIYRRSAERAKKRFIATSKAASGDGRFPDIVADVSLPLTTQYLHKKLAVEDLRERATSSGLDPSVIRFDVDPIAEEALLLLTKIVDLKRELDGKRQLEFDLEAERRNVEYYKSKLRDETQQELAGVK